MTTRMIHRDVVKCETLRDKVRFTELEWVSEGCDEDGVPYVGDASVFVSHRHVGCGRCKKVIHASLCCYGLHPMR